MSRTKQMYLGHVNRQRADAPPLALLLRRARLETGLNQRHIVKDLQVSDRTLSRWEAGDARPTREWREHVAIVYGNVSGETWRALVAEMKLPLEAMLAKVPQQRAKLASREPEASTLASSTSASSPITPKTRETRARIDEIVRAAAEDLDVTARRLRATLANVLAELDAMKLSPGEARVHVLERGSKPA